MNHNFDLLIFFLIFFSYNFGIEVYSIENKDSKPELSDKIYSFDLNSNETEIVKPQTPLSYTIRLYEGSIMKNTGYGVEISSKKKCFEASISGGILGNSKYRLFKTNYYWKNNLFDKCSTFVDGIGTPLEITVIYYKEDYGTFEIAKSYPDGVAIIILRISVNKYGIPNLRFKAFQESLGKIIWAGSQTEINYFSAALWYIPTNYTQNYYTCSSSFATHDGINIKNAIVIHSPMDGALFISWKQFQEFLALKNYKGEQLIPKLPEQKYNSVSIKNMKGIHASFDNIF